MGLMTFAPEDLGRVSQEQDRWSRAMHDLRAAALGNDAWGRELLMPRILEAVRAYARVGEIIGLLREVWGEYTELNVI
jgi:methylmalonyl-CoA mutase N-terminal domain/subunit